MLGSWPNLGEDDLFRLCRAKLLTPLSRGREALVFVCRAHPSSIGLSGCRSTIWTAMDCQPCGSLTSSGDMDGRRRGNFCVSDKLYVRKKWKKLYVSLLMV